MLESEMGNIYADPPMDSPRPSSKTGLVKIFNYWKAQMAFLIYSLQSRN